MSESPFTLSYQTQPLAVVVAILQENIHKLAEKDKSFAASLVASYTKKGSSTPNQEKWLRIMCEKAVTGKAAVAAQVAHLGDYSAVYAMFAKAKAAGLQKPKIKLKAATGQTVVLRLSGASSAVPGVINITNGKGYNTPAAKWYGRIFKDGKYEKSGKVNDPAVDALLADLAKNPAQVTAFYGKQTGNCCFCGLALTDAKSVTVGYGPICAGKYGLPWGEATAPGSSFVAFKYEKQNVQTLAESAPNTHQLPPLEPKHLINLKINEKVYGGIVDELPEPEAKPIEKKRKKILF